MVVCLQGYWLSIWIVARIHQSWSSGAETKSRINIDSKLNNELYSYKCGVSWTMPGHINSLWLSDAICQHWPGSPLAQVMACCLTAPSHYLNQCWLIIKCVLWPSPENNFTRCADEFNPLTCVGRLHLWNDYHTPRVNELTMSIRYKHFLRQPTSYYVLKFTTNVLL